MNKTIALVVPTASQTIERAIIRGAKSRLDAADINLLTIIVDYLPKSDDIKELQLWIHSQITELEIAGIIFYGGGIGYQSSIQSLRLLLQQYKNIPMVNIGCILPNIPSVIVDNKQGMTDITNHLIEEKNCKTFGFVSGPKDNQDAIERLDAFNSALTKHNISTENTHFWQGDFSMVAGKAFVTSLLDNQQDLPNAIICANDLTAKGVVDGLSENNIQVGEDVLVTGYDDFEYAQSMYITLTSARYPADKLGATAADALICLINGRTIPELIVEPSQAVFRQSTGVKSIEEKSNTLLETWSLIKQRDMNSNRLMISREFSMRTQLMDIFRHIPDKFFAAGIKKLYLYPYTGKRVQSVNQGLIRPLKIDPIQLNEGKLDSFDLSPIHDLLDQGNENHNENTQLEWIMCPLLGTEYAYGYILVQVDFDVSDFVEFTALQITDMLNNEFMHLKSETLQNQVYKSEQMAALGGLVSGVAHEINTPLGVSILAMSHLDEEIKTITRSLSDEALTKSSLNEFIETCNDTSKIVMSSLNRAAELINNFKQVSVDQTAEDKRLINLKDYIESILGSLKPEIKRNSVEITTHLEDNIQFETFPGAWAQLITNFIMNAFTHAFNQGESGKITITLKATQKQCCLNIKDNGKGMDAEIAAKIFDPFFTTRRGSGGSGLGLHIAYNLVTQRLGGTIKVETQPGVGTEFLINIPLS